VKKKFSIPFADQSGANLIIVGDNYLEITQFGRITSTFAYKSRRSYLQKFNIQDENFAARVKASFERQGFMEFLGAKLHDIGPGTVEINVLYHPKLSQQHGYFHGGLIGTLADNAAGYAAFTLMGASDSVLTVEYKLNIMSPASGELLIARARVLRPGQRVTVCQSDIFVKHKNQEKQCATMLGTFMRLADSADQPAI
jgi:uncharacterized protein (TIGR00369 family)